MERGKLGAGLAGRSGGVVITVELTTWEFRVQQTCLVRKNTWCRGRGPARFFAQFQDKAVDRFHVIDVGENGDISY